MDLDSGINGNHVGQVDGSPAGDGQAVIEVRRADPANINEHWGFIRSGLEKIRRHAIKVGLQTHWLPEHVKVALHEKRADCWLVVEGDAAVAFVITQVQTDPFVNLPLSLFVWHAYSLPGHDVVAITDAFIEQRARESHLRWIDALTARPGLPRRLAKFGWRAAMTIIRKDLIPQEAA